MDFSECYRCSLLPAHSPDGAFIAVAVEYRLVIREAEQKARGVMEECRMRTDELRRELIGLRREKETYLARFRSLAESQVQFIDAHRSDFEDLDRRLGDIADSVVSHATPAASPGYAMPAPQGWQQPAAYGPPPAAPYAATAPANPWAPAAPVYQASPAPYAAPTVNTAPVHHTPSVAPIAPAASVAKAPAAPAGDIWRDYVPGRAAQAQAPAQPVAPTASSISSIPTTPARVLDEDVNGLIAHSLVESPASGNGPEAPAGEQESWRPEPVVTEVANL